MAHVRSTRSLEAYACMFPEQVSVTHIDRFSRKEIYLALGLPSVPISKHIRATFIAFTGTQDNFSCTKPNDKSENSMKLVIIGRSCLISGV